MAGVPGVDEKDILSKMGRWKPDVYSLYDLIPAKKPPVCKGPGEWIQEEYCLYR